MVYYCTLRPYFLRQWRQVMRIESVFAEKSRPHDAAAEKSALQVHQRLLCVRCAMRVRIRVESGDKKGGDGTVRDDSP
jgi:ribosomal protein L44E